MISRAMGNFLGWNAICLSSLLRLSQVFVILSLGIIVLGLGVRCVNCLRCFIHSISDWLVYSFSGLIPSIVLRDWSLELRVDWGVELRLLTSERLIMDGSIFIIPHEGTFIVVPRIKCIGICRHVLITYCGSICLLPEKLVLFLRLWEQVPELVIFLR